eukprot:319781_1
MAEQRRNPALAQLQLRQEALLNKLDSLQLRLNDIQREQNIDVTYDLSKVTASQFKKLQSKQSSIFETLLNIAVEVENVGRKQNIPLPAQNEVANVIHSVAKSIEKRQQQSITQLKVLSSIAESIQPWLHPPGEQKVQIVAKEEQNKYKSRRNELQLVSDCLRVQCNRMDPKETDKVTKQQLNNLLEKVSLIGIDASVENEKHIQVVIDELSTDSVVDYNVFLNRIVDMEGTDQSPHKSEWNMIRCNLIGEGRVDGGVRILYRYDGWPEPLSFVLKGVDTKDQNNMTLKEVLTHIDANSKDSVEYQELRYAENPTFVPGRRGWQKLNAQDVENENVAFLVNNDGTLEIDIWLRTKGFITNNKGRPMPEEDEEDLVDV